MPLALTGGGIDGAVALDNAKGPGVGSRAMSPTEPKMITGPIGPIPRMLVRLVPDATTAARVRFLEACIWVSNRRGWR